MNKEEDKRICDEISLPGSEKSVIVVAHPDDEVLWFSSVLEKVDHVIFCYMDVPGNPRLTNARRTLANTYPLQNISRLGFDETGAFNAASWDDPVIRKYGIDMSKQGTSQTIYEAIFPDLVDRLIDKLADYQTVFTHNPWGEYGHEEHVQVSHAVQAAQIKLGFDCWYSGYISTKSEQLMNCYGLTGNTPRITCLIDQELKEKYISLYKQHGCWTWHNDWERFEKDIFYKDTQLQTGKPSSSTPPKLNRVRVDREYTNRLLRTNGKEILREHAAYAIPKIINEYTLATSKGHYLLAGSGPRAGTTISNTAAIILGLCDGQRTVSEISELISELYNNEKIDVETDILNSLIECNRRDILTIVFDSYGSESGDA